jgi:L-arabinose isomerase
MSNEKKVIKSFEEGAEVSGDLLTGGREKTPFKLGLLTCGYFEYWRMYPMLKEKVEKVLAAVTADILKLCPNTVRSGLVDTLDGANEAGRLFKRENVDAVLLVCGTYMPDFISLTAIDHVADKPLILFSMQSDEDMNLNGDYEEHLRNSGIIGSSQFTGTLRKIKRDYVTVVGSIKDPRAYRKIGEYLRGAAAVKFVTGANIGVIGHVFRGMYDIEISKTFYKSTFGANIIQIQSGHLLELWQGVTDEETDAVASALMSRFKMKNITADDVRRASRLAVAMEKIVKKFGLDAMCFLDQHFLQRQTLTSARIGASLITENLEICVNCEGDLGGLMTMMLLKSITGQAPLMAEWAEYDSRTNSCFLVGHGIAVPAMAASDADIRLTRTPEEWGLEGAGLNYEFVLKPGSVTLAHILEAPEGYRLLIGRGDCIQFQKLNIDEVHAAVSFEGRPVKEVLERVFDFGVSHHCIIGHGDAAAELAYVAKLLKIGQFIV